MPGAEVTLLRDGVCVEQHDRQQCACCEFQESDTCKAERGHAHEHCQRMQANDLQLQR